MAKGLLGKKIGMTQVFNDKGEVVPVTVIEASPSVVLQTKNTESDGYNAVQLGYDEQKAHRVTKPMKGHFAKANVSPKRYVREVRVDDPENYQPGQEVKVSIFSAGELVDVTGISKGKGFAGVVKRHGFNRGPMSHGSMYHRRVGSLGATDPARVFKGRRLPGRMGGTVVTTRRLTVVKVDEERNVLLVKGAVPGPKGTYLIVKASMAGKASSRS